VTEGTTLRDECVRVETNQGKRIRADKVDEFVDSSEIGDREAVDWVTAINEWRDWLASSLYKSGHIRFESSDGEVARCKAEHSFMESYAEKYYARFKSVSRAARLRWGSDYKVDMLTFSATNENGLGGFRAPVDHMREIADGFDTARKQLYHVLDDEDWCYLKMWEPHESGYGHMHLAILRSGNTELSESDYAPVMESYVDNVVGAGSEVHLDTDGGAVATDDDRGDSVDDPASYLIKYLGAFAENQCEESFQVDDLPDGNGANREMHEQMFYAVCWASNTRRVEMSQKAADLAKIDQWRQETYTMPEDRGESPDGSSDKVEWEMTHSVTVSSDGEISRSDPRQGGVGVTEIDGVSEVDPPKPVT
jgi:hypothetical protein